MVSSDMFTWFTRSRSGTQTSERILVWFSRWISGSGKFLRRKITFCHTASHLMWVSCWIIWIKTHKPTVKNSSSQAVRCHHFFFFFLSSERSGLHPAAQDNCRVTRRASKCVCVCVFAAIGPLRVWPLIITWHVSLIMWHDSYRVKMYNFVLMRYMLCYNVTPIYSLFNFIYLLNFRFYPMAWQRYASIYTITKQ